MKKNDDIFRICIKFINGDILCIENAVRLKNRDNKSSVSIYTRDNLSYMLPMCNILYFKVIE